MLMDTWLVKSHYRKTNTFKTEAQTLQSIDLSEDDSDNINETPKSGGSKTSFPKRSAFDAEAESPKK